MRTYRKNLCSIFTQVERRDLKIRYQAICHLGILEEARHATLRNEVHVVSPVTVSYNGSARLQHSYRTSWLSPCSAEVAVGWSWLPTGSGRSQLELVARSGWRNFRLFAVIPGYVEFFPKMHFTRLGVLAIKMIGSAGRALSRGDLL